MNKQVETYFMRDGSVRFRPTDPTATDPERSRLRAEATGYVTGMGGFVCNGPIFIDAPPLSGPGVSAKDVLYVGDQ